MSGLYRKLNISNERGYMNQAIKEDHKLDENGNPAGGKTTGTGIDITWQDGPLGRGTERREPNGAFVEGVIKAAIGRLLFYQGSKFACWENEMAIACLEEALEHLTDRTARREREGSEGTHKV